MIMKLKIVLFFPMFCLLSSAVCLAQESSSDYVKRAQVLKTKNEFDQVCQTVNTCIKKFSAQADELAGELNDFPLTGEMSRFQVMNDVATCYFIKGESLRNAGRTKEATRVLREVIDKYPYAQGWDPRGWYYSIAEKGEIVIAQIEGNSLSALIGWAGTYTTGPGSTVGTGILIYCNIGASGETRLIVNR